mmetsp:Transcript_7461/g.18867  ORF Transcript_7461/g.18867 Transcript_7461/m.18867 type:complete len:186 (-) Transcript_7461:1703-2260(-)
MYCSNPPFSHKFISFIRNPTTADIVESLLGAAHVDGGFEAGQRAVYHALKPMFLAVKGATAEELQKYCYHPKRNILSELGCLASVDTLMQESLAQNEPNVRLWAEDAWVSPDSGGSKSVSILRCLDNPILAVSDAVMSSSINRVCAFVLAFLAENKKFLERTREMKADIQRSLTGGKQDKQVIVG